MMNIIMDEIKTMKIYIDNLKIKLDYDTMSDISTGLIIFAIASKRHYDIKHRCRYNTDKLTDRIYYCPDVYDILFVRDMLKDTKIYSATYITEGWVNISESLHKRLCR